MCRREDAPPYAGAPTAPYGTPEWVEQRRGGIGASEMAALVRRDPYRTEYQLWELKTGRVAAFAGNAKSRWGHRLERLGLEVWAQENIGGDYLPGAGLPPITDPRWPHLWASLDGIGNGSIGIEVKVTSRWTQPPDHVQVQCLAQMGLAGLEAVDVVRLSFEDDPVITRIERDEGAITDLLDLSEAWYVRHVIEGVEPERPPSEYDADEEQAAAILDWRRVRVAMERLQAIDDDMRDRVKAWTAGAGTLVGQGFRVVVTPVKGARKTDWKTVAREMVIGHLEDSGVAFGTAEVDAELAKWADDNTTVGNGYSRVEPTWSEGPSDD